MTIRWIPIVFIWMTVAATLLELFSQLQLMLTDARHLLSALVLVFFLVALIVGLKQFIRDSQTIQHSIQSWDDEMKNDILTFLHARKLRLITALVFLMIILLTRFLFPYFSDNKQIHEVLVYIFLIALFHVALISSLILFKLSRTIKWINHENEMAVLEKP